MLCLGSLPPAPIPEYVNYQAKVRKWSTVQAAARTYSVPSRLIGKEVRIRLYADWVEVYYKDNFVERMARMHGEGEAEDRKQRRIIRRRRESRLPSGKTWETFEHDRVALALRQSA